MQSKSTASKVVVLNGKKQTICKVRHNVEKDCIEVSYLQDDATWQDCMIIVNVSVLRPGFIASMIGGISY
jgi:hypothetical protein